MKINILDLTGAPIYGQICGLITWVSIPYFLYKNAHEDDLLNMLTLRLTRNLYISCNTHYGYRYNIMMPRLIIQEPRITCPMDNIPEASPYHEGFYG